MSYVYLIKGAGRHYKIGIARDVKHRLRALQTGSPAKLRVVRVLECENCAQVEREMHARFADRRTVGEWFKLEPADVKAFGGEPVNGGAISRRVRTQADGALKQAGEWVEYRQRGGDAWYPRVRKWVVENGIRRKKTVVRPDLPPLSTPEYLAYLARR